MKEKFIRFERYKFTGWAKIYKFITKFITKFATLTKVYKIDNYKIITVINFGPKFTTFITVINARTILLVASSHRNSKIRLCARSNNMELHWNWRNKRWN